MIRETIKFTEELIADIPDVMQCNIQPSKGLHVIVELDKEGHWNKENSEFYICPNSSQQNCNTNTKLVQYEQLGLRVGTNMNKVLDLPAKQIFSCSPFILSFKKKSLSN